MKTKLFIVVGIAAIIAMTFLMCTKSHPSTITNDQNQKDVKTKNSSSEYARGLPMSNFWYADLSRDNIMKIAEPKCNIHAEEILALKLPDNIKFYMYVNAADGKYQEFVSLGGDQYFQTIEQNLRVIEQTDEKRISEILVRKPNGTDTAIFKIEEYFFTHQIIINGKAREKLNFGGQLERRINIIPPSAERPICCTIMRYCALFTRYS